MEPASNSRPIIAVGKFAFSKSPSTSISTNSQFANGHHYWPALCAQGLNLKSPLADTTAETRTSVKHFAKSRPLCLVLTPDGRTVRPDPGEGPKHAIKGGSRPKK